MNAGAEITGRRPVKMLWSLRYAGVPVIGSCLAASRVDRGNSASSRPTVPRMNSLSDSSTEH